MTAAKTAAENYIRVSREPDAAKRAALLEECFAETGRVISRSRAIAGRAAIAEMFAAFFADPQNVGVRVLSFDAAGNTFRFRVAVDRADGTSSEIFDAGAVDEDGRIAVILTFVGPMP